MLKRTLFFGSSGSLRIRQSQLVFEKNEDHSEHSAPVEDLGFVIIESPQIMISTASLQTLGANQTAVVVCDDKHLPAYLMLPMTGHSTAEKQIRAQLSASDAMKDRLWKQTVSAKIRNQAQCLRNGAKNNADLLSKLAGKTRNGDPENLEGTAARFYFSAHFPKSDFVRDRFGEMPNAALNYGYAVLRAAVARALTGSGLLCVAGIHHKNQYNSFVLADDIMEPYRPFIDDLVLNQCHPFDRMDTLGFPEELTREMKAALLSMLASDVMIRGMRRPLMNALSYTSASLAACFLKEETQIAYPEFASCRNNSL